MRKEEILKALKEAKETANKRNFKQKFDLIINIKHLNLKKSENQFDDFVELHYQRGKETKVCALVGPELEDEAKKVCNKSIRQDEFSKLSKKELKKIGKEYDYFIAQANIMPQVASAFGQVLGPRGKMPNPKVGCVVPPKANLGPLQNRLQKTVKLSTKNGGSVKTIIGNEDMVNEEIADNILTAYNHFLTILPTGKHNISEVLVKMTMGPAIKIEGAGEGKSGKTVKETPKSAKEKSGDGEDDSSGKDKVQETKQEPVEEEAEKPKKEKGVDEE
ncbi:50S ribosomal protein L1 [Candidatus Woesearchaeota archaeon]|nr:50S ribosomal protein L1 [Candidatus Woesearchaeota archaeon]